MALPTLPAKSDAKPVPMTENDMEEFCPILDTPLWGLDLWIAKNFEIIGLTFYKTKTRDKS